MIGMKSTHAKLSNAVLTLALLAGPLTAESGDAPGGDCPLHAEHAAGAAGVGQVGPVEQAGQAGQVEQVGRDEHAGHAGVALPATTGQDAFAALAEVASLLAADPATDWRRVDLDRLREHLVDMSRVALEARVEKREVAGGFAAEVTGPPPVAAAVRRMVKAHGRMMDGGAEGWAVEVEEIEGGVRVTVSDPGGDASRVAKLRGLGFFGFMTAGDHHRAHHLALATGRSPHAH